MCLKKQQQQQKAASTTTTTQCLCVLCVDQVEPPHRKATHHSTVFPSPVIHTRVPNPPRAVALSAAAAATLLLNPFSQSSCCSYPCRGTLFAHTIYHLSSPYYQACDSRV